MVKKQKLFKEGKLVFVTKCKLSYLGTEKSKCQIFSRLGRLQQCVIG